MYSRQFLGNPSVQTIKIPIDPKYSSTYIRYQISLTKAEHGDRVGARIARPQCNLRQTAAGRPMAAPTLNSFLFLSVN